MQDPPQCKAGQQGLNEKPNKWMHRIILDTDNGLVRAQQALENLEGNHKQE